MGRLCLVMLCILCCGMAVSGESLWDCLRGDEKTSLEIRGALEARVAWGTLSGVGKVVRFEVPPQKGRTWPGFSLCFAPRNMKGQGVLYLDVVNAGQDEVAILPMVSSRTQAFNKGFTNSLAYLPEQSHTRIYVNLEECGKKTDLRAINRISIALPQAPHGATLMLAGMGTVRAGELPKAFGHRMPKGSYAQGGQSPQAPNMLFDFEDEGESDNVLLFTPAECDVTTSYASHGHHALRFVSKVHENGENEWRALRLFMPEHKRNWSNYDWLVFDVVNPTGKTHHTRLFIPDSKREFRTGFRSDGLNFQPWSHQRVTIPLAQVAKQTDITDVRMIHFIVHKPVGVPYEIHVDNVHLLAPSELSPTVPEELQRKILRLKQENNGFAAQSLLQLIEKESQAIQRTSVFYGRAQEIFAVLRKDAETLGREFKDESLTVAGFERLQAQAELLPLKIRRVTALEQAFRRAVSCGQTDGSWAWGVSSAAETVMPCEVPFVLPQHTRMELELARNEQESSQLHVLAGRAGLQGLRLELGDLRQADGGVFPHSQMEVFAVGYLRTGQKPSYPVSYVGWYPRLLLEQPQMVDVPGETVQSFVVRYRCGKNQKPGVYEGTVQLKRVEKVLAQIPVRLKVRSFALPDGPVLPTAMSCSDSLRELCKKTGEPLNQAMVRYGKFLGDYRLQMDRIYSPSGMGLGEAEALVERKALSVFNLGNMDHGIKASSARGHARELVERLRTKYQQAKTRGLLKHAYVYGFDEAPAARWGRLAACADWIHRELPGLKVMTTVNDPTYGAGKLFRNVDWWCPLINFYDETRAAEARKRGSQVWWYISSACSLPYPNVWLERDVVDMRMMNGWMSARLKPDGLLYYAMDIWGNNEPVSEETTYVKDWNPRSFGSLHGDGCVVYPGKGGKLIPSFALENMRDGFEDLAWYRLLEQAVEDKNAPEDWRQQARSLLRIPSELVTSPAEFSRSVEMLMDYRRRIGNLLEMRR